MKNKYLEQNIYIFKRIRYFLEDAIQDESGLEDVFQALKWARNWKELEKNSTGRRDEGFQGSSNLFHFPPLRAGEWDEKRMRDT